ncbi:hypothetical protein CKAH01_03653 [Colletotrichum kahawae]|uniref:Uncharacterized protein n=1 Tax=Colletotrichum kahawae TaxID=34407 RepID=A0AAD9YRD0_COLKA|nr:hypothetical protein CKAH01_03653 [Colletotrichum kahawae]
MFDANHHQRHTHTHTDSAHPFCPR